MTDNKVVAFRHKGKIDDPLTEILRSRARRRWRSNSRPYWARTPISSCWTAASALFGTVMIRSTQSSQGSGRWRWKNSRRGIAGRAIAEERIRYSSSILPKWARRTKSLDGRAFGGQRNNGVTLLPRLNFQAETNACQQQ